MSDKRSLWHYKLIYHNQYIGRNVTHKLLVDSLEWFAFHECECSLHQERAVSGAGRVKKTVLQNELSDAEREQTGESTENHKQATVTK